MADFSEIENKINAYVKQVSVKMLNILAVEAEKSIKRNFESGGRPAWAARRKISKKQKGKKLLVIAGNLKNVSAEVDTANNRVVLKSNPMARAYARIHQEGGEINMPARELKFRRKRSRSQGGGQTVFAGRKSKKITAQKTSKPYKITIPPRPYLVIPPEDHPSIMNALGKAL